jgi:hypothetical protein
VCSGRNSCAPSLSDARLSCFLPDRIAHVRDDNKSSRHAGESPGERRWCTEADRL